VTGNAGSSTNKPEAGAAAEPSVTSGEADKAERWVVATKQVRTAAQWTIASLGAGAAIIFGSGPIVAGGEVQGTGTSLTIRVLVLLLFALVGAAGVIYLIVQTAEVLLPHTVALASLPPAFVELVKFTPHEYLPTSVKSLDEFKTHLRDRSRALKDNRSEIERLRRRETMNEDLLEHGTEQDKGKAKEALSSIRKELVAREVALKTQEENVEIFVQKRNELLEQSAYQDTRSKFTDRKTSLALAAAAAVIGGVGYVVVWGVITAEPTPSPVRIGLMAGIGDPGNALWENVGLENCAIRPGGPVPVIVESGTGTASDPFFVRTLGVPSGCAASSFPVLSAVATVTFPSTTDITIEYEREIVIKHEYADRREES
jgi:hypothetical protein